MRKNYNIVNKFFDSIIDNFFQMVCYSQFKKLFLPYEISVKKQQSTNTFGNKTSNSCNGKRTNS